MALVLIITFIGAILRIWQLDGQSLWLDEAFTARVAPLDLGGILAALRADLDTPPLHPLLVHAFLILGNSDFVLRLPSALAGILCIPLMFAVVRRLSGVLTGLLAAALMALSPFALYYSQEARMYTLLLLFALLAWYCLERALTSSPHPPSPLPSMGAGRGEGCAGGRGEGLPAAAGRGEGGAGGRGEGLLAANARGHGAAGGWGEGLWWAGFVLSTVLAIYTHFFGFLLLGLLVIYAASHMAAQWAHGRRAEARRKARNLLLSLVVIGILYLPWLPVLLNFVRENYAANPYGQRWHANLKFGVALNIVTLMLGGFMAHPVVRWVTRGLLLVGALFLLRRRPLAGLFIAVSSVLPFGLLMVLNPGHFVTTRYFIFMLPMLIAGMAEGLAGLANLAISLMRRVGAVYRLSQPALAPATVLAALAVVALLSASGLERYYNDPPRPAWRRLAQYVAKNTAPDDLIVVATFPFWDKEPLQHYMKHDKRRVVYAAEDPNLKRILASERRPAWWVLYSPTTRPVGGMMHSRLRGYTVVPFDYLALVRKDDSTSNGVDDGVAVLTSFVAAAPTVDPKDVQRVINGLESSSGDIAAPGPAPVPTVEN